MRFYRLCAFVSGLAVVVGQSQSLAADDWNWLSPPKAASELFSPATSGNPPLALTKLDSFEGGEIRQRDGAQTPVTDAVFARVATPLALFQLAADTLVLNSSTAEIIISRSEFLTQQIQQGAFTEEQLVDAVNFFSSSLQTSGSLFSAGGSVATFDSSGSSASSTFLSFSFGPFIAVGPMQIQSLSAGGALVVAHDDVLGRYSVADPDGLIAHTVEFIDGANAISHFQPDSAVFYAFNLDASGDHDYRSDGFVVDAAAGNSVATNAAASLLASFSHTTSLTGNCPGCSFDENDAESIEASEIGINTTHGVAWATVLPPFDVNDTNALSANGALAYITAQALTPRDQLPSTGMATFDTVVGGSAPFASDRGAGSLSSFSATVNFATAEVTALSLAGQFEPTATFSAASSGGPAAVQANGTFTTPLAGSCSFCSGALSGTFGGGFTSGGAALLGAYGLRPASLTGSTSSIVGSVLATQ